MNVVLQHLQLATKYASGFNRPETSREARVTQEQLADATRNKTLKNHRVEFDGNIRHFYYYSTEICQVNEQNKTFWVDASYGSTSTTQAVNAYRGIFSSRGYREVTKPNDE